MQDRSSLALAVMAVMVMAAMVTVASASVAGAVQFGLDGTAGGGTGRGVGIGRILNIHIRRFGVRPRIRSIPITDRIWDRTGSSERRKWQCVENGVQLANTQMT